MNTSKSKPANQEETLNYVDQHTEKMDQQRSNELHNFKEIQNNKQDFSELERKRLSNKYGADHPKVQKLDNRLKANSGMFEGLNHQIEFANTPSETLPKNSWRIHGKVFDQSNKPVKGVTVYLSDPNGGWIEALGNSCTTENGYYAITVDEKILDRIEKSNEMINMSVSDKDKKILYISAESFVPRKGIIKYFNIYLNNEECATPPGRVGNKPINKKDIS